MVEAVVVEANFTEGHNMAARFAGTGEGPKF